MFMYIHSVRNPGREFDPPSNSIKNHLEFAANIFKVCSFFLKKGMIFLVNHLPADDSQEISSPVFPKNQKKICIICILL